MKKTISFGVVFLFMLNVASAQQTTINKGILPDSPIYFLDLLLEEIQLKIAENNPELRIRLKTQFLSERILESQFIANKPNNKPQLVSNLLLEIKTGTDDLAQEAENVPEAKEFIGNYLNNSMIVLTQVKEKFETDSNPNNDNAISGLNIAISNQAKKIEAIKNKPVNNPSNPNNQTIGGGY